MTVGRVTAKGITQLPPCPNAMKLTGNTTEVLPIELHFFKGAVLRLYHGLVGSKNRKSGFKILFFSGYQRPKFTDAGLPMRVKKHHKRRKHRGGKHEEPDADEEEPHQRLAEPAWELVDPKTYRYAGFGCACVHQGSDVNSFNVSHFLFHFPTSASRKATWRS